MFSHSYNFVFATHSLCLLIDLVVLRHTAVVAVKGAVTVNAASNVGVTFNVGATVEAVVLLREAG